MDFRTTPPPHAAPLRHLRVLAALLATFLAAGQASAQGSSACSQVNSGVNALCLAPSDQTVLLGDSFTVQLDMSFFDVTVGGEVFLNYDNAALTLLGVSFDSAFPDDPDFRCPGSSLPCQPDQLAFGNLSGLSGVQDVLTLTFQADQLGAHPIGLENDQFSDDVGGQLTVQLFGSSVTVVPEPATSSLLALGLLVLTRLRHPSRRPSGARSS